MSKNLGLGFLGLVFVLAFQNCSPVSFQNSLSLKMSDSGVPYGGKPTGTFYRFVPDFTCENKEAPNAVIQMTETSTSLIENKKLLCGAIKVDLDPSLLDTSIYQNEVIGYQEGIFEGESTEPSQIPANLVEVWCRDSKGEEGIETITYYDRLKQAAVNRIYYSKNGNAIQIPDFSVARVIANKTVFIKDEKGFELTVHRDRPAAQVGLFVGELSALIDGQKVTRETNCRLGGSLDSSLWPAKQIVDLNVNLLKISANGSYFSYTSDTGTGILSLYGSDMTGQNQLQLSPKFLQSQVLQFSFSPDSNSIIYNSGSQQSPIVELFKVNVDGTSPLQLNSLLRQSISQSVSTDFKISADKKFVLYRDGSQQNVGERQTCLRSVPIEGGPINAVSLPLPHFQDMGVFNFDVSKTENKVAYFAGGPVYADLYISNIDGSNLKNVTPSLPTSDWHFNWYTQLFIPNSGSHAIVEAMKSIPPQERMFYAVALDGSGSLAFPKNWRWEFSSANGSNVVLVSNDFKQRKLINLKTAVIQDLPVMYSLFFAQDSLELIGNLPLGNGELKAVSVSMDTGRITDLCAGLSSSVLGVKELEANSFIISAYDQNAQILNIYRQTWGGTCFKINSVAVGKSSIDSIGEIVISPDREKIFVILGLGSLPALYRNQMSVIRTQILYIPLNGKPAYVVNTPVLEGANILDAFFSNDSRSVIYVGNQIRAAVKGVFLWRAPQDMH